MSKPCYILGLSAYYHDSAAALLRDGEIVAAAQEERFTRVKGDAFAVEDDPRALWMSPQAHLTPEGYRLAADVIGQALAGRWPP